VTDRYRGWIDTGRIGVPGAPSNGTDEHPTRLRRSVRVFTDEGATERELWAAYAGFDAPGSLRLAVGAHGAKALRKRRRRSVVSPP
jgi:hypothetical protein